MKRRSMLVSLLSLVVGPRLAGKLVEARGLDKFLTSNIWATGPPLTEKVFIEFLDSLWGKGRRAR